MIVRNTQRAVLEWLHTPFSRGGHPTRPFCTDGLLPKSHSSAHVGSSKVRMFVTICTKFPTFQPWNVSNFKSDFKHSSSFDFFLLTFRQNYYNFDHFFLDSNNYYPPPFWKITFFEFSCKILAKMPSFDTCFNAVREVVAVARPLILIGDPPIFEEEKKIFKIIDKSSKNIPKVFYGSFLIKNILVIFDLCPPPPPTQGSESRSPPDSPSPWKLVVFEFSNQILAEMLVLDTFFKTVTIPLLKNLGFWIFSQILAKILFLDFFFQKSNYAPTWKIMIFNFFGQILTRKWKSMLFRRGW